MDEEDNQLRSFQIIDQAHVQSGEDEDGIIRLEVLNHL